MLFARCCRSQCCVQIYPENATQAEMMVAAAMKVLAGGDHGSLLAQSGQGYIAASLCHMCLADIAVLMCAFQMAARLLQAHMTPQHQQP